MGRTVPSFRNVLAMEKKEWNTYRNALDNKEKIEFDEMWDIARLHLCLLQLRSIGSPSPYHYIDAV
jgi:hypothetical protein